MNFLNEYLQNQNCVMCLTDSFFLCYFCYFPFDIAFEKYLIQLKPKLLQKKLLKQIFISVSSNFFPNEAVPHKSQKERKKKRQIPKFTQHIRRYIQCYAFLGYRAALIYNKQNFQQSSSDGLPHILISSINLLVFFREVIWTKNI